MRTVLDKLISWTGLALAVVLLAAGGLLTWANVFIDDQVKQQLTMQDITMPEGRGAGEPLEGGPRGARGVRRERRWTTARRPRPSPTTTSSPT